MYEDVSPMAIVVRILPQKITLKEETNLSINLSLTCSVSYLLDKSSKNSWFGVREKVSINRGKKSENGDFWKVSPQSIGGSTSSPKDNSFVNLDIDRILILFLFSRKYFSVSSLILADLIQSDY